MDARDRQRVVRKAGLLVGLFVALNLAATLLFMLADDQGLEEAAYRAIGSFTTVDLYPGPDSTAERALTALFAVVGGLFYLLLVGSVVRTVILPTLEDTVRERRVKRRVESLRGGHFVVCGFGNIGSAVARSLRATEKDVVVIDRKPENVAAAEAANFLAIEGQAHDPSVLNAARVGDAAGLVASVGSDAENIYIALAAKRCNREIYIVARASSPEAERNMAESGAFDLVRTPYEGAGRALAQEVVVGGSASGKG